MSPQAIIVIVLLLLYFLLMIGIYIYKKVNKIPFGECASCYNKGNNLLKEYRKKYRK